MAAKRVLVVDDNPGMARLIQKRLEADGHSVATMNSSMEVLAAVDAGARFDVFVLDVQMQQGEPHGISLAKMLGLRQPAAAIIFVASDPDLVPSDEFAGRTVFPKPIDFAALRRAVAAAGAPAQL
jgi:CheY-like chemotaxis protein